MITLRQLWYVWLIFTIICGGLECFLYLKAAAARVYMAMSDLNVAGNRLEDGDIQLIRNAVDYAFRFPRLLGYQDYATTNLHTLMTPWQRHKFQYQAWYFGHHHAAQEHDVGNPIDVDGADAESDHPSMPDLESQRNSPEHAPTSPPFNLVGRDLDVEEDNEHHRTNFLVRDNA